jgi:predicted ribosome quality control (RQC) complex YloA/Tae2 family protein
MELAEAEGSKADELSYRADLITAFTYAWQPRNAASLECTDFVTGEPVVIAIPQGLTPSEVSKSLYTKARKLRRAKAALTELIKQVESQLTYLGEIQFSLDSTSVFRT